MGVYIMGMEMPFIGSIKTIVIYPDGTVRTRRQDPLPYTAVSVPPHGRLIDADALRTLYEKWHSEEQLGVDIDACHVPIPVIRQNIDDAPTIIPEEEDE